jgi:small redox-active disulfide protein 2
MIIKVLGTGCANCKKLEINAKEAVSELGIDATVLKVEDVQGIIAYGVMKTPALVIDEKVKSMGKVLSTDEIIKILK